MLTWYSRHNIYFVIEIRDIILMDGLQAEHKSYTKAITEDTSEGPIKCDHVR